MEPIENDIRNSNPTGCSSIDEWEATWKKIQLECDELKHERRELSSLEISEAIGFGILLSGFFFWSCVWFVCQCFFRWDLYELYPLPFGLVVVSGALLFDFKRGIGQAVYDAIDFRE